MTLDEILRDIHAMEEDLLTYERKYGVSSDTFYESYRNGEEPADNAGCSIGATGPAPTRSGCAVAGNIRKP